MEENQMVDHSGCKGYEKAWDGVVYDMTMVGGGPVGLFAAFYSGLRGCKTAILESLSELGGQLVTLYPEKLVYDVAGFPKILAKDLAANLIEQAMQAKPAVYLNEMVQDLRYIPLNGGEIIELTSTTRRILTKTVILCNGLGAFTPKKLTVPGVEELDGRGVYYFVKDLSVFTGRRLVIVGGGDTVFDWILHLHDRVKSVTLVHRRDGFRAMEESVNKVKKLGVPMRLFWEVKEVYGEGWLTGVRIFHNKTKEEEDIEADAMILGLGFETDLSAIERMGIKLDKEGIVVNERMETNLPGLYAAGDVASSPVKIKLIATGFGEAVVAVNCAQIRLDPKAKLFPGYSSTSASLQKNIGAR